MSGAKKILHAAAGNVASENYWVSFYFPNVSGNNQREGFNIYGVDTDDDGNIYISGSNDQALNFTQGNEGARNAGFACRIDIDDGDLNWWTEAKPDAGAGDDDSDYIGQLGNIFYDANNGDLLAQQFYKHRDDNDNNHYNNMGFTGAVRLNASTGAIKSAHNFGTQVNNYYNSSSTISQMVFNNVGSSNANNTTFVNPSDSSVIVIDPESSQGDMYLRYTWDNSNEAFTNSHWYSSVSLGGVNATYGHVKQVFNKGTSAVYLQRKGSGNTAQSYLTEVTESTGQGSTSIKEHQNFGTNSTWGSYQGSTLVGRKSFANDSYFMMPWRLSTNNGKGKVAIFSSASSCVRQYTFEDDDYPRHDSFLTCIDSSGYKHYIFSYVRDGAGSNGRMRIYEMEQDGSLANCIEITQTTNNWDNGNPGIFSYPQIFLVTGDTLYLGNMAILANDPTGAGPRRYILLFKLPKDLSAISTTAQTVEPTVHGGTKATLVIQRVTANVTIADNGTSFTNVFTRSGGSSGTSNTARTFYNETTDGAKQDTATYTSSLGGGPVDIEA